jgi:hypothetical protein
LVENDNIPEDIGKIEIDEYLDSSPIIDFPMNEVYEVRERKGDDELVPPKHEHLPKELQYKVLDDTNKYHVIISVDLTKK